MKVNTLGIFSALFCPVLILVVSSCTNSEAAKEARVAVPVKPADSGTVVKGASVDRGRYLVKAIGCAECHSPKVFTAFGPVPDSSRLLAGSPADNRLLPIDKKTVEMHMALSTPDVTAFGGPWGVSFAANLTSDSATGIGAWTEENFISTIRTGKHLGVGGRPILPPMPWSAYAQFSDDDLKSIFLFLKTVPAVSNRVHQPITPPEVAKIAK